MSSREAILNQCREFYQNSQQNKKFVPGESYIPPSGKVVEADDLANMIDATLDMWLTTGRYGAKFEHDLAQKMGARGSRLTVSGSAANLLAFTALTSPLLKERQIKPGDEVITVAAGFPTTVTPIVQNGCIPVFVDVDLKTHNIDVRWLEEAVGPKTKAVMVAHTLGNPFNLEIVKNFCDKHNLFLIEDCCDALGAQYDDKPVGSFGDLGTLSFYPAHQITMGEGGAVFGSSGLMLRIVESFRDWGRDCWCPPGTDNTCKKRYGWQLGQLPEGYDHKYVYAHLGYNLKVTDMQAAIGCTQLQKVDGFIAKRRENYEAFKTAFNERGWTEFFDVAEATPKSNPSWFGLPLTVKSDAPFSRNEVVQYLEKNKVGTRLVFAGNLIRQPAFHGVNYRTIGDLRNSDEVMNRSFWTGVWPGIGEAQRTYILETFEKMLKELKK